MHISNRTLIEILSAGAAIALITDASVKNVSLRKLLLRSSELNVYMADILQKNEVPVDRFDEMVLYTILEK